MSIRPAVPEDRARLGALAEGLVRLHHDLDPQRFLPGEGIGDGYGRWLAKESQREGAVVLVAEHEGVVVGYCYGTLEGRNYNDLLDAHGKLHDVFVDPSARRHGLARALVSVMVEALSTRGAPRVVLATAVANEAAQALFASLGFRRTMIEMTREADR